MSEDTKFEDMMRATEDLEKWLEAAGIDEESKQHIRVYLLRLEAAALELQIVHGRKNMLATRIENQYTLLESQSQGHQGGKMHGAILEFPPAIMRLVINAPRPYYKYFCHVCHREWVGYEIRGDDGKVKHPDQCNWCGSTVWHHPEKGAFRRIYWLRKQEQKQGNGDKHAGKRDP